MKTLRILGTRGLPAAHGGFETFAEHLALHLVKRGWHVVVYCQADSNDTFHQDVWHGIDRVHIPIKQLGPKGTIIFDWLANVHASKHRDLCLTLGYNTAVFCALLRLKNIPNLINMDGIEWSRMKWGLFAKVWFWMNDWAGCFLGNHLVADHPQISLHLQSRVNSQKITTIPYGADRVTTASTIHLQELGLIPGNYLTVIARPEPENSLFEIVQGFSASLRGMQLVVLGAYHDDNLYHRMVKSAASSEVLFVGAIYDKTIVQALRYHCAAYVHGHQVGGTNPSLVEALGCGNAVIAHDNRFNRWVAGDGAIYFSGADSFASCMDELIMFPAKIDALRERGLSRFKENFTWSDVLQQYEDLLCKYLP